MKINFNVNIEIREYSSILMDDDFEIIKAEYRDFIDRMSAIIGNALNEKMVDCKSRFTLETLKQNRQIVLKTMSSSFTMTRKSF
jgi:hypothetical protein